MVEAPQVRERWVVDNDSHVPAPFGSESDSWLDDPTRVAIEEAVAGAKVEESEEHDVVAPLEDSEDMGSAGEVGRKRTRIAEPEDEFDEANGWIPRRPSLGSSEFLSDLMRDITSHLASREGRLYEDQGGRPYLVNAKGFLRTATENEARAAMEGQKNLGSPARITIVERAGG